MRSQSPDWPRGDVWAVNTLDRATKLGQNVYERALSRKIEWPKPLSEQKKCSHFEDPMVYTSIDDAFATVLQCMSQTTRQCKRYYGSHDKNLESTHDQLHCRRFHTPHYTAVQRKNPLLHAEDVHIVVSPGTYAVTTGVWGKTDQQTHVVHVNEGQTANLDFVL
ncbi:hypothetical protein CHS0354_002564 [Potamilus streckersoni]|uniref:Uncharacterized protein n=1 Tax=Potamilus streckersoni TaxID=2493646 RepID=A0AAE0WD34_9BIVA|nr:hypothetical protein CHS0354_002564 [Potamilus streckersoni]